MSISFNSLKFLLAALTIVATFGLGSSSAWAVPCPDGVEDTPIEMPAISYDEILGCRTVAQSLEDDQYDLLRAGTLLVGRLRMLVALPDEVPRDHNVFPVLIGFFDGARGFENVTALCTNGTVVPGAPAEISLPVGASCPLSASSSDGQSYRATLTHTPTGYTVSGGEYSGMPIPDIDVIGNGNPILDGSTTPVASNHTDFGNIPIGGGFLTRTFTIQNSGAATLTLTGAPVTISGNNASDFMITTQPSGTIGPSSSTSFQVRFEPSAAGSRTATISIASNDPDENPFDFAIQGNGTLDFSLTVTKMSDVPSVDTAGDIINYTIAVTNTGNAPLTGITIDDPLTANEFCPSNTLGIGGSMNCTASYTVQQSDINNNGIDTNGVADGDGDIGNTVTINSNETAAQTASARVVIGGIAELTAVKSSNDTNYGVEGDVLTYEIVVTNTGDVPLTGLVIDDPLTNDEACPVLTLAPSVSTICTASYQITAGDISAGSVNNTAFVTTDQTANQPTNTVTVNFDPAFIRNRTQRVISNFIARRADQITANGPELVNRLNNCNAELSQLPFEVTGSGVPSSYELSFATSLRQITKAPSVQHSTLGISQDESTNAGECSTFDIWARGTWSRSEQSTTQNSLGLYYIGADYHVSSNTVVGLLGQFDWTDEKDDTANIAVEGLGWMVGPYIVTRLSDNLLFDGRAAWGRSDNNVTPLGTYTDAFQTSRWLLEGQLTGDFSYGNWKINPEASIIYFEEQQHGYTDSNNIQISDQVTSLGRLNFGPRISTQFDGGNGVTVAPHVSVKGIWDFEKSEILDLDTGLATGSDTDLRARLEGGISLTSINGWNLTAEGFYDGIGVEGLAAYGGSIALSVPLN